MRPPVSVGGDMVRPPGSVAAVPGAAVSSFSPISLRVP